MNLCSLIRSPGFWKNWDNHFTEAQFQAIIAGTAHYSNLTVAQAEAILDNNGDQYHRHLLSAELNVSWNPQLGNAIYNFGSLAGMTVNQILDLAFNTDPANASDDLIDAVLYLGSEGENDTLGECRLLPPNCPTRTPTNTPTNTPTKTPTNTATNTPTNTPRPPTDTPTNTNTPTNTPIPPTDTPTNTPTLTKTSTPTKTPTLTKTPTKTPTKTATLTKTPTRTPTKTKTPTPVGEQGQLKICKVAGPGVIAGRYFTFTVGSKTYNVPAGYCVLAGQYVLNTNVTVQETIQSGYTISKIEARPSNRLVSQDKTIGKAVVKIGTGVTEVLFTNTNGGAATPTRTPSGPTPTSSPKGRLQICKEASGSGVSGNFTFRFETRSRSIPVDACSLIISVNAGTLVVKEDARSGYVVSNIYTIPANRLISKNLSNRTATVTIIQGTSASQTIVVFVNRAVSSQAAPEGTTVAYNPSASNNLAMFWNNLWDMVLGANRRVQGGPVSN